MTGFRSVVPTLVIGLVIGLPAEGAAAPQDLTVAEQSSFRPITRQCWAIRIPLIGSCGGVDTRGGGIVGLIRSLERMWMIYG